MDCSPSGSSLQGILQARILNGFPCPPPGDLPDPESEPASPVAPALQADSLPLSHRGSPKKLDGVHRNRSQNWKIRSYSGKILQALGLVCMSSSNRVFDSDDHIFFRIFTTA